MFESVWISIDFFRIDIICLQSSSIIKVLPRIPRETYYVATKVGRYEPEVEKMFDFRAERVLQSVDESLQRLGLEYIDIIQVSIHKR